MSRSKFLIGPFLALLLAGLSWGTTAIFVRLLGRKGFTSFELLEFRLLVVGAILLPVYFAWFTFSKRKSRHIIRAHGFKNRTTYAVGASMVLYYLGAIVAVQNLPLVLAVMLIGSSPLLAWIWLVLWPFVKEWRKNRTGMRADERLQGIGVALGVFGLIGFAVAKSAGENSGFSANAGGVPLLGYLAGFMSSVVTVFNSRVLKNQIEEASSPVAISLVTAGFGLLLFPLLLVKPSGHDTFRMAKENIELLIGFGVIATLVPGIAQAFASSRLSPVLSSTVTIQLQLWTAVFGWLVLDERLSPVQFFAAGLVLTGTLVCLLATEAGVRMPTRLK